MRVFSFNHKAFNYWPIYDAIKKYYPIGLPFAFSVDTQDFYRSYPGIVELDRILIDNTHSNKNYRERWVKFEKQLKNEFGKVVEGTTHGQAPSYSGFVILEKRKAKELTVRKELHCSISYMGPFYTIYGLDTTSVLLNNLQEYSTINAIT